MSDTVNEPAAFVPSPAPYSKELYPAFFEAYDIAMTPKSDGWLHLDVYDPMAANGIRLFEMVDAWAKSRAVHPDGKPRWATYSLNGSEIEREFIAKTWIVERSMLDYHGIHAIVQVSPAYGNRMCIAAGSMVTTDRGSIPIEQVEAGDMVLTHRSRWRKVTRTFASGVKPTVEVDITGARLRCTADHRIWSAHRGDGGIHSEGWRPAAETVNRPGMADGSWYRFHYAFTPKAPAAGPVDEHAPRGSAIWWALGFYVGNGSTDRAMAPRSVKWTKDATYMEAVAAKMTEAFGRELHESVSSRMAMWRYDDSAFASWVRMTFGANAATKDVPGWVFSLEADERSALLDGWLAADGCRPAGKASSVGVSASKALVTSMKLLAASVDRSSGYAETDGAAVSILPQASKFVASHRLDVHDGISRKAHLASGGIWAAVKGVSGAAPLETYDLEVEEDHSFTVNGIAVHNSDQYLGTPAERDERAATGKKPRRVGYAVSLGRKLSPGSGAALQVGPKYREFHRSCWQHVFDYNLIPGGHFILNVKSHYRGWAFQDVAGWHFDVCGQIGFELVRTWEIECPGMRDGQNREARDLHEYVYLFRKPQGES